MCYCEEDDDDGQDYDADDYDYEDYNYLDWSHNRINVPHVGVGVLFCRCGMEHLPEVD
jgi:hypothetical protein